VFVIDVDVAGCVGIAVVCDCVGSYDMGDVYVDVGDVCCI